jgi:DNA-directed RNA polymerase subunit L
MKKILTTAIAISLLSSGITFADTSSSTSQTPNNFGEKIKKVIDNASERKDKVEQKIKKIEKKIETVQEKFLNNFDVAIQNLDKLSSKTGDLIQKMTDAGKDISLANTLFASSTLEIVNAKTEYSSLQNLVSQTATSTVKSKKNLLISVKTQSEKTKIAIKTAHADMVNVIQSLKDSFEKDRNASSTEATTSEENASTTNQ